MAELLLEVRAEEIPDRMLQPAVRQLAGRLFEDLTTRGMAPLQVETGYTPRRLVVVIRGFAEREPDREEQVIGPPSRVAFKPDGTPTPALEGFARRCGIPAEQLQRIETEKGEYLAATLHTSGRSAAEVLAELVPQTLAALSWAKNMRWGTGVGPWVRPVHGLVVLLDGQVLPCELFGVAAGDVTIGHPILSPEPFRVTGIDDYFRQLAARGLEVRPAERRGILTQRLEALAAEAGGRLVEDAALLEGLTGICEVPGVIAGRFDAGFLELPREVLGTSLRDHQHAFTVEGESGLLPTFLTVMDRPDDPQGRVRSGNEWVVAARLEDARFFYAEDRKMPLADRRVQLERLTFHDKLGSYADKAARLADLAEHLCAALGWTEERAEAVEAARLLKADLPTEMVKEFDSLQGIMGGLYARGEGYSEAVWQALYDQYLPASTEDALPRGRVGQITALADRLDTLAGIFGLGLIPSGSKDPFGLRRAAQALVRILLERGLALDPWDALAHAVELYGDRLTAPRAETLEALRTFVLDRVKYLLGRDGFAYDEIEAVLAAGVRDLPELKARLAAVHQIREQPGFLSVALSARRIANILRDAEPYHLDPKLFQEPAEQALHDAYQALAGDVEAATARGDHLACLERVGQLAEVLDRFFVDVMVMAEDPAQRRNRIALLQAIDGIVSRTARLTELVVDKAEHRERTAAGA